MPVASLPGYDYDGQEHHEAQFGVAEQEPVAGQVTLAGTGRAGGMGVPVTEPDAAVGVVGTVGESLGMRDIPAERRGLAHGAWSGVTGVHDVQCRLGPQVVMAEQDPAGLSPVRGHGRVPENRRSACVRDSDGHRVVRGFRREGTWGAVAHVVGVHRVLPAPLYCVLPALSGSQVGHPGSGGPMEDQRNSAAQRTSAGGGRPDLGRRPATRWSPGRIWSW